MRKGLYSDIFEEEVSAKESSGENVVRGCDLALEVSKLVFSSTEDATTGDSKYLNMGFHIKSCVP